MPIGQKGLHHLFVGWSLLNFIDYDEDGCDSRVEDNDDDNDGILDDIDQCPEGLPFTTYDGWVSTETNDPDGDGALIQSIQMVMG